MTAFGRRILIVIPLLLGSALASCHTDTENERITKVITSTQKAAENKEIKKVLSSLSKTYRDPQGNDYQGIKDLLLFYFFRHQKISVLLSDLDINIQTARATAGFQAVLSGRNASSGGILPEALGAYRFEVTLTKEAGEWKITSAKWERFGDGSVGSSRQGFEVG